MAALFALGVMSLGWMAFIAALIAIEKLLPWRALANRGIAVLLLVLGLGVAFTPESVPGLTLPGSPKAMRAMQSMGMDEGSMDQGGMKECRAARCTRAAPVDEDDSMGQGGSGQMKDGSMGQGGSKDMQGGSKKDMQGGDSMGNGGTGGMHDDSMGNAGSGGKMSDDQMP